MERERDIEKEIEKYTDRERDWLWLSMIPGIYRVDKKKLLDTFGSPRQIRQADEKMINNLSYLKQNQKKNIILWLSKKEEQYLRELQESEIHFYSYEHEKYPEHLKEIADYPYGMFVRGELPDPSKRCIAIVGARTCTNYGRKMAQNIAQELVKRGVIVVSGMALGIDGIAQMSALEGGGSSIAVIGSGCDICYPREHIELFEEIKEKGAIISEYPPGIAAYPSHFPQRNRIISGMCEAVVVIEAKDKSGSLITADMALEQARDVYAVPGRMDDPLSVGCNQLIAQGAGIICSVESLLENLGFETKTRRRNQKQNPAMEVCENMVYLCLDYHGKSLEELVECTRYSEEEVLGSLLKLQLKGLAVEVSKNRYAHT